MEELPQTPDLWVYRTDEFYVRHVALIDGVILAVEIVGVVFSRVAQQVFDLSPAFRTGQ